MMTNKQFRKALDKLGLSEFAFARLIGRHQRTINRWALGERTVPPEAEILVKLLIDEIISIETVAEINLPPNKRTEFIEAAAAE